jgi:chromate transport protein ChrA
MSKRLALLAIRLFVSVNLLYAAIFLKFAGVPGSVALFTQMSQTVHGLVSQPVFRLGSGVFETVAAVLLLISKTARLGAGFIVVWMTAVILSHIFVLGYGWFFVDALMVMLLAAIYLLLTRRHSHRANPKVLGRRLPYKRTQNSREQASRTLSVRTEKRACVWKPNTSS